MHLFINNIINLKITDAAKVAALGFALTLVAWSGLGTVTPAYAACVDEAGDGADNSAGASNQTVNCDGPTGGVRFGYETNGFDNLNINVNEDGEATGDSGAVFRSGIFVESGSSNISIRIQDDAQQVPVGTVGQVLAINNAPGGGDTAIIVQGASNVSVLNGSDDGLGVINPSATNAQGGGKVEGGDGGIFIDDSTTVNIFNIDLNQDGNQAACNGAPAAGLACSSGIIHGDADGVGGGIGINIVDSNGVFIQNSTDDSVRPGTARSLIDGGSVDDGIRVDDDDGDTGGDTDVIIHNLTGGVIQGGRSGLRVEDDSNVTIRGGGTIRIDGTGSSDGVQVVGTSGSVVNIGDAGNSTIIDTQIIDARTPDNTDGVLDATEGTNAGGTAIVIDNAAHTVNVQGHSTSERIQAYAEDDGVNIGAAGDGSTMDIDFANLGNDDDPTSRLGDDGFDIAAGGTTINFDNSSIYASGEGFEVSGNINDINVGTDAGSVVVIDTQGATGSTVRLEEAASGNDIDMGGDGSSVDIDYGGAGSDDGLVQITEGSLDNTVTFGEGVVANSATGMGAGSAGIAIDDDSNGNTVELLDGATLTHDGANTDGAHIDDVEDNTLNFIGVGTRMDLTNGVDGAGIYVDNSIGTTVNIQDGAVVQADGDADTEGMLINPSQDTITNIGTTGTDPASLISTMGDGYVVDGTDPTADANVLNIGDLGLVRGFGNGVVLEGDDSIDSYFEALFGGADDDGAGNDVNNSGVIRAGADGSGHGVLVSNTNSDVDNSGGEIYAQGTNSDGVRMEGTIHTNLGEDCEIATNCTGPEGIDPTGISESVYQSDADSFIFAGRDGLAYEDGIDGLGETLPAEQLLGAPEIIYEHLDNEGMIVAADDGISVNDYFDVVNFDTGQIIFGGLSDGSLSSGNGGDGINAGANNIITNNGLLQSGTTATADSHGIEVTGGGNTITNNGRIVTVQSGMGNGVSVNKGVPGPLAVELLAADLDKIDLSGLEPVMGADGVDDTGAGGDGIHADVDGETQGVITNADAIIAEDDGIQVGDGGSFLPEERQVVINTSDAYIVAKDDGIVGGDDVFVTNQDGGLIGTGNVADDDGNGSFGINLGDRAEVDNSGFIVGEGGGIKVQNAASKVIQAGVTNTGVIDVGTIGLHLEGDDNDADNLRGTPVSAAAILLGAADGGLIQSMDTAVRIDGDRNDLFNDGDLIGGMGPALLINGDFNEVDSQNGLIDTDAMDLGANAVQINGNTNIVNTTDITGDEDGINITGDHNVVDVVASAGAGIAAVATDGNVTAENGDGVDIDGGDHNVVNVAGFVSGDPGVVINNGNHNDVIVNGNITGALEGVLITNGSHNVVESTTGAIQGGSADGLRIDENSNKNEVTADLGISSATGGDGVEINGNDNFVGTGLTGSIGGFWDGVEIGGNDNLVEVGSGGITGTNGEGVQIGSDTGDEAHGNTVTTTGRIVADQDAVQITGNDNLVIAGQGIQSNNAAGVNIVGNDNEVDSNSPVTITGATSGVLITGNDNIVTEDGLIDGLGGDGVNATGAGNVVEAFGITGTEDGVELNGAGNTVNVGGFGIDGATEEGVQIGSVAPSDGNVVDVDGDITGNLDAVQITGDQNTVTASTIDSASAAGVNITGDQNQVSAEGVMSIEGGTVGVTINGDENVVESNGKIEGLGGNGVEIIQGDGNVVDANTFIQGTTNGAVVGGNNNTVQAGTDITGTGGAGASISGDFNTVSSGGTIDGQSTDGVNITGNENDVTATTAITGVQDGVQIDGNENDVETGTISGGTGAGVDITGDGNDVAATAAATISGATGVNIAGNQNNVSSAGDITGTAGNAVTINGDDNIVSTNGAIDSATALGIEVTGGSGNTINAASVEGATDAVNLGSGNTLLVDGNVNAEGGDALILDDANLVDIGGDVTATGDGIVIGTALDMGDNNIINIDGSVDVDGDGIKIWGNNNDITVAGTLDAGGDAFVLNGFDNNRIDVGDVIAGGSFIVVGSNNDVDTGNVDTGGTAISATDNNDILVDGNINAGTGAGGGDGLNLGDDNDVEVKGYIDADGNGGTGGAGIVAEDDNKIDVEGDNAGVSVSSATIGLDLGDDNEVDIAEDVVAGTIGIQAGDDNEIEAGDVIAGALGIHHGVTMEDDNELEVDSITAGGTGIIMGDQNIVDVEDDIDAEGAGIVGGDRNIIDIGEDGGVSIDAAGGAGVELENNNIVDIDGSVNGSTLGMMLGRSNDVFIGGDLTGGSGGLVAGRDNDVFIDGNVGGGTGDAINIGRDTDVDVTGDVSGERGVVIAGDDADVTVDGSITGTGGTAISIAGDDSDVSADSIDGSVIINGDDNDVDNDGNLTNGSLAMVGDDNDYDGNTIEGSVTVTGEQNTVNASAVTESVSVAGDDNNLDLTSIGLSLTVNGDDNDVDTDGGNIGGDTNITGDQNTLSAGNVEGELNIDGNGNISIDVGVVEDGLDIDGNLNNVVAESITSANRNGVDINGDDNNVTTTGNSITGVIGVNINGDDNDVDAGGLITGTDGIAVQIDGDDNDVESTGMVGDVIVLNGGDDNSIDTGDITGLVNINGDDNDLDAGAISGTLAFTGDSNKANITSAGATNLLGDDNNVTATGDLASLDVTGDDNDVDSANVTTTVALLGDDNTLDTGTIGGSTILSGDHNRVDATSIGSLLTITGDDNNVDTDGGAIGDAVSVTGDDNNIDSGNVGGALTLTGDDNNADVGTIAGAATIGGDDNNLESGNVSGDLDIDGSDNTADVGTVAGNVEITGDDNTADTGNVTGGLDIDGDDNTADVGTVAGAGIDVTGDDNKVDATSSVSSDIGIDNQGDSNTFDISGTIQGLDGDGISNVGDNNTFEFGGIGNSTGWAIDSEGNKNSFTSTGTVVGVNGGVNLDGDDNDVSVSAITGNNGTGLAISGSENDVDVTNNVTGTGGVTVSGSGNNIDVGNDIEGNTGVGVDIGGSGNILDALDVSGDLDGLNVSGDGNIVTTATVDGGDNGVDVVGDGNIINTTDVTAGEIGVNVSGDDNVVNTGNITVNDSIGGANISGDGNIVTGGDIGGNHSETVMLATVGRPSESRSPSRLIHIDPDTGDVIEVFDEFSVRISDLESNPDTGQVYAMEGNADTNTPRLMMLDPETGELTAITTLNGFATSASSITYDDTTDTLYGVNRIGSPSDSVFTIDPNTGATVALGDNGDQYSRVAIDTDSTGDLVLQNFSSFNSVDKSDGSLTFLFSGGAGVDGEFEFGPGDVLYAVTGSNGLSTEDDIYIIDQTNGTASFFTDIGKVGNGISGLAFTDLGGFVDGYGVQISGEGNIVEYNNVRSTGTAASITGDGNDFDANDLTSFDGSGLVIAGNANEATVNSINAGGGDDDDGLSVSGTGNIITVAESIRAGGDGVDVSGVGNILNLNGVSLYAEADGITNFSSDNDWNIADIIINAWDDGIVLGKNGTAASREIIEFNGTINADDDGITGNDNNDSVAETGSYWDVVNTGTINADTDDNNDGTGIFLEDFNQVVNEGTITGWNGIEVNNDNIVINNGTIDVENIGIHVEDRNYVENNSDLTINTEIGDGINANNDNGYAFVTVNNPEPGAPTSVLARNAGGIFNNGTIDAGDDAIEVANRNLVVNNGSATGDDDGVELNGVNNVLVNNVVGSSRSSIQGGDEGVEIDGNDNVVINYADISSDDGTTDPNNADDGVDIDGSGNFLLNTATGVIRSEGAQENTIAQDNISQDLTPGPTFGTQTAATGDGVQDFTTMDDGMGNEVLDENLTQDIQSGRGTGSDGVSIGDGDDDGTGNSDNNNVINIGLISGAEDGIEVNGSSGGSSNNVIINAIEGVIEGRDDDGVEFDDNADSNTLFNRGTVRGEDNGVLIVDGSNFNLILNASTSSIIGGSLQCQADGRDCDGVHIDSSSTGNTIWNGINADTDVPVRTLTFDEFGAPVINVLDDDAGVALGGVIRGEEDGIDSAANSTTIYNTAGSTIEGDRDDGIELDNNSTVNNSGTILGGVGFTGPNPDDDSAGIDMLDFNDVNNMGGWIEGGVFGILAGDSNDIINANGRIVSTGGEGSIGISVDNDNFIASGGEVGLIQGTHVGIAINGTDNVVANDALITGEDAGIYVGGETNKENLIVNFGNGVIRVTGTGEFPAPAPAMDDDDDMDEETQGDTGISIGFPEGAVAAINAFGSQDGESEGTEGDDDQQQPANVGSVDGDILVVINAGLIDGADAFGDVPVDLVTQDDLGNVTAEVPDGMNDFDVVDNVAIERMVNVQQTNRFAVLGGEGSEIIVNTPSTGNLLGGNAAQTLTGFTDGDLPAVPDGGSQTGTAEGEYDGEVTDSPGGIILGDIYTDGGDDILALGTGSIFDDPNTDAVNDGNADLGQDLELTMVPTIVMVVDDPETEVDESEGGTAMEIVQVEQQTDVGIDTLVLYGEGTGEDRGVYGGTLTEAELLYKVGPGTWDLNGNVTIDGAPIDMPMPIDRNGDGIFDDDELNDPANFITETVATEIHYGRLNVGGSLLVPLDADGDGNQDLDPTTEEPLFVIEPQSQAELSSPVVEVLGGGTLGGHGTVITDPSVRGGNGGVNVTGRVSPIMIRGQLVASIDPLPVDTGAQDPDTGSFLADDPDTPDVDESAPDGINDFMTVDNKAQDPVTGADIPDDAGTPDVDESAPDGLPDFTTVDNVTQNGAGVITAFVPDGVDDFDGATGNVLQNLTFETTLVDQPADPLGNAIAADRLEGFVAPENFIREEIAMDMPFDLPSDTPKYGTINPGDETTKIGTLTVVGNVNFSDPVTDYTTYVVGEVVPVDAISQDPMDGSDTGAGPDGIQDFATVDEVTQDLTTGDITDGETGDGIPDFLTIDTLTQDEMTGEITAFEPDGIDDFDPDTGDVRRDVIEGELATTSIETEIQGREVVKSWGSQFTADLSDISSAGTMIGDSDMLVVVASGAEKAIVDEKQDLFTVGPVDTGAQDPDTGAFLNDDPNTPDVDESAPDGINDFETVDLVAQDPMTGEIIQDDPFTPENEAAPDGLDDFNTVDNVTQDEMGNITDDTQGDGIPDFDMGTGNVLQDLIFADTMEPNQPGQDGIPDTVAQVITPVEDGNANLAGRLNIVLDGKFVDVTTNGSEPTIPTGGTGCDDAPDGTPNCETENPAFTTPDGIPDVDENGNRITTADYSDMGLVYDIIKTPDGAVNGTFSDLGFDGGPNDGAIVLQYDDPSTPDVNEEVRVQVFKAALLYLPQTVRIISIPSFADKGNTQNQNLVGAYIDSFTQYGLNTDSLHEQIAYLGKADNIAAGLEGINPEWFNAFNEAAINAAMQNDRQVYLRTLEAQFGAAPSSSRVVMNVTDNSTSGASGDDNRAAVWVAGQFDTVDVSENDGFLNYDFDTVSGFIGFDYEIIDNTLLIGIMGGFGNTDIDFDGRTGEGDIDQWNIGGYLSYFTEDLFAYIQGGIGDLDLTSERDISFGSQFGSFDALALADYDGDFAYISGKAGYSFDIGENGIKLTPEIGLAWVEVEQDAFAETGAGNLNLLIDEQSAKSFRVTAQLRVSKTFKTGNGGHWTPYLRAGIAHEFEDDLRAITGRIEGVPNSSFTVFGEVARETTGLFGVGVNASVSEMISLFLDYEGEFGGGYEEHSVTGGLRLHF